MALLRTASFGGKRYSPRMASVVSTMTSPETGQLRVSKGLQSDPQSVHPVDHRLFYWCPQLYLKDVRWLYWIDYNLLFFLPGGPCSVGGRIWGSQREPCQQKGKESSVYSSTTVLSLFILSLCCFFSYSTCSSWEKSICLSFCCLLPYYSEGSKKASDCSVHDCIICSQSTSWPFKVLDTFMIHSWMNEANEYILCWIMSNMWCHLIFKLHTVSIFSFRNKDFGSQRWNNTSRTTQLVISRTEIFI